jgi:hypothetical protein
VVTGPAAEFTDEDVREGIGLRPDRDGSVFGGAGDDDPKKRISLGEHRIRRPVGEPFSFLGLDLG